MNKRPLSITIISWIFIAVGCVTLTYHLLPRHSAETQNAFPYELAWICFVRVLALVCGVFMLFGYNWARWLLAVWLAYHVILSGLHAPMKLAVHSMLFAAVVYFLFRPAASAYFRYRRATRPGTPNADDNVTV
jgi:hypothetical protein